MLVSVMASRVPGLAPTTKVGDISPEQWDALYSGPWRRWLKIIDDDGASNTTATTTGTPLDGRAETKIIGDDTSRDASDNADDPVVQSSDSSGEVDHHPVASHSSVPIRPWLSEDGASYYPTTLAEGEEVYEEGKGDDGVVGDEAAPPTAQGTGENRGTGSDVVEEGRMLSSLQEVMATYYKATQSNEEFDSLRSRCFARITATLAKLRERTAEFERQLAAAQEDKV